MNKYRKFVFENYDFNESTGQLELYYSYDTELKFCETYKFDFEFIGYDPKALDRALQMLFFMAGVSYYKMYLAPKIEINAGHLDQELAKFFSKTYQKGLGEFFYVNGLDPNIPVNFPINSEALPVTPFVSAGQLIGLGGGKDSLVSVEMLHDQPKVATWSLNHRSQLEPLVDQVGLTHFWVEREWDPQIKNLNQQGALNGHVPISAIFSCVGGIVAILSGYKETIVSNESSASEPTMTYQGVSINHQYSKSLEYEKDYQECINRLFDNSLSYYSLLRPFTELRIAELFSELGFNKYRDIFSSCNRAYTHDQHSMFWCGECSKCAFVFLVLTPFINNDELKELWQGKNLLLDKSLEPTYRQLLGIQGNKPFDCVGEIKESRAAMKLAQDKYPELNKYQFELPANYDFRAWGSSSMPPEMLELLEARLSEKA